FFASTTNPYLEKSSAALMAETLPFEPKPDFTVDFSNSLRACSNSVLLAGHTIARTGRKIAIAAADIRETNPFTADAVGIGDGAAAIVLAECDQPVAELKFETTFSFEILDTWRKSADQFLRMTEPHFRFKYGFSDVVTKTFTNFLKSAGMTPDAVHHIAINAPNAKMLLGMLKRVNLSPAPNTLRLYNEIGNTGVSFGLLNFLAELEAAKIGENILWLDYGDGANSLLFQKKAEIDVPQIEKALNEKIYLNSYDQYLRLRNRVKTEEAVFEPFTSAVMNFREKAQNYALMAQQCKTCGDVIYPHERICKKCNTKDNFGLVPIGTEGKIFTFTREYLFPSPEGVTAAASADMTSGVRLFLQITDSDYDRIAVGQTVERTFRKMHDAGGFHNYYWKFRVMG
ncbi:MAG TPA: hypothetical protein ENG82_03215, partial [Bacteroidetes bacterium]|nr:hypothetical protein [Bacteroidota bacterium]